MKSSSTSPPSLLKPILFLATLSNVHFASVSAVGLKSGITKTIQLGKTDFITTLQDDGSDTLGDVFTWDRANQTIKTEDPAALASAEVVGDNQGHCIRLTNEEPDSEWDCDFTIFFPDGQLHVHGPFNSGVTECAITGGTGAYEDATGFLELSFAGTHDADGTANQSGTIFSYNYNFHLNLAHDDDDTNDNDNTNDDNNNNGGTTSGGSRLLSQCGKAASVVGAVQLAVLGSMPWW